MDAARVSAASERASEETFARLPVPFLRRVSPSRYRFEKFERNFEPTIVSGSVGEQSPYERSSSGVSPIAVPYEMAYRSPSPRMRIRPDPFRPLPYWPFLHLDFRDILHGISFGLLTRDNDIRWRGE